MSEPGPRPIGGLCHQSGHTDRSGGRKKGIDEFNLMPRCPRDGKGKQQCSQQDNGCKSQRDDLCSFKFCLTDMHLSHIHTLPLSLYPDR